MPTGTGKTEIALAIVARHQVSALVVTPLRDLMYQWHRRIASGLGVEAGLLGDGHRDVRPITMTTYDSAWIHMKDLGNRFRLVVYDEAHHLPGPALPESALDCLAPLRLGLTATPGPVRRAGLDAGPPHRSRGVRGKGIPHARADARPLRHRPRPPST